MGSIESAMRLWSLTKMSTRIVQSRQNSRLKELRRALRTGGSTAEGAVAIEGPNLLAEAVKAGLQIHSVFAALGSEQLLDDINLAKDTEVLLLPRENLIDSLTTESPQPVAALIRQPAWNWPSVSESDGEHIPLFLVLDGIQDPGNLGTILRSAEAFGATGLISLPGTVSTWNPKAVRASAGSVFRLPQFRMSIEDCFTQLHQMGVTILATKTREAPSAMDLLLTGSTALLIGSEGSGLDQALIARADGVVTIPCPGPVESLNAAVAASVLLYEAARQRRKRAAGELPSSNRGERQ